MTDQTATPAPAAQPITKQPEAERAKNQEPIKRKRGIARWMHRHRQMLTFIGAVIIFWTFFVKDVWRDRLRNWVDSVNQSQSVYQVRTDLSEVRKELQALRDIMSYGFKLKLAMVEPISEADVILLDQLWASNQLNQASLVNTEQLMEKLPKSVRLQNDKTLKAIRVEESTWEKNFWNAKDPHGSARTNRSELTPVEQLDFDATRIQHESDDLAKEVLQQAQEVKSAEEHRYTIATWASYFLYTMGWGLALVGRLVGVETGAGE